MSIEDVILAHDRRGISALRAHLGVAFCDTAARFLLRARGNGTDRHRFLHTAGRGARNRRTTGGAGHGAGSEGSG